MSTGRSGELQDIWIICREHPGETPASFVLEGLVNQILQDSSNASLLSTYRINIVPMFNMDGVANGNYYRNAEGIDIAQDWEYFRSSEIQHLYVAMRGKLESGNVALVINLHSANAPRSHFFLETPNELLPDNLALLQRRLIHAANDIHPQLQISETVALWEYPEIAGNYLSKHYGVYCLYVESNYSIGADRSVVSQESLRELGSALSQSIAQVLVGA